MRIGIEAVILGVLLDFMFGDPVWLYHPVRLMGKCITFLEGILRRIFPKSKTGERIAGAVLLILTVAVSTAVPAALLSVLYHLNFFAGFALESFFCYQMLAAKSLKTESMKVYRELQKKDIAGARYAVSMIVGRDTEHLDEAGVTKAAVETVAENASDGVIAPLFYMMLGGAAAGFAYKAVNTMDSMIGYKNEKYRYFGTAAARLDDVVNFIPARLSGLALIAAAMFTGEDWKNAWRIFRRDRRNHASPNSAQTESAMAGALRVRLAGDAWYFGKLHEKPYIGDDLRKIEAEDIVRANRMLYAGELAALAVFAAVRILFILPV